MNVLQINSSSRPDQSHSNRLAAGLVQRLRERQPDLALTVRDLGRTPHPALDETALQALFTPAAQRTPSQAARVAQDDALIAELQAADVLVLAVPMYNFGVPAALKHWIDAVARAGVTFRYTEQGPQGLLRGKQVYVVLTRGGQYRDTATDTQVPYLRTVLGFLGMTDLRLVYAEGLAMGAQAEQAGLAAAQQQIEDALPQEAAASAGA